VNSSALLLASIIAGALWTLLGASATFLARAAFTANATVGWMTLGLDRQLA